MSFHIGFLGFQKLEITQVVHIYIVFEGML